MHPLFTLLHYLSDPPPPPPPRPIKIHQVLCTYFLPKVFFLFFPPTLPTHYLNSSQGKEAGAVDIVTVF